MTLPAIDTARAGLTDELLDQHARRVAHQLGEVTALLSAGVELGGAVGERSLRAAQLRLVRFVADLHDLDMPVDPSWERLRLSELVTEAAAAVDELPGGERITVTAGGSLPAVIGDRDPLVAMFSHLLRFLGSAARPGAVRVDMRAVRRGDRVRITLSDDRTDLGPDRAAGLLEPFAVTPGRGPLVGAGFGLVAARRIVAAHGGRIEAAPRPPSGAMLSFDLPGTP